MILSRNLITPTELSRKTYLIIAFAEVEKRTLAISHLRSWVIKKRALQRKGLSDWSVATPWFFEAKE